MVRAETLSAPGLCADGEAAAAGRARRTVTVRRGPETERAVDQGDEPKERREARSVSLSS